MLDQLIAETHFINDGGKSRLVIGMDWEIQVIEFQVAMIRNNQISGLLPLELRRVDSRIQLYYDVTGKWRLKDILDNKEFDVQEFVVLLDKFIQVLTGAEAYLLEITQFVIGEEHIFLDGNLEPRLLYLPVKGTQNIHERFKELVVQLIVYRAKFKEQDSGAVLSTILNYLKRDNFNIYEFHKNLRNLKGGGSLPQIAHGIKQVHPHHPPTIEDLIPNKSLKGPPPVSNLLGTPSPKDPEQVSNSNQGKAQLITATEYKTKMKYKHSVVIIILVFQALLAAGVLLSFETVYKATGDITTACASIVLMVICLDGLILKNLLKTENRIEVKTPVKTKVKNQEKPASGFQAQPSQRSFESSAYPVNLDKQVISNAQACIPKVVAYDTDLLTPRDIPDRGCYDTVVLSSQSTTPYLIRKGALQDIIQLRQPNLVLGRQADLSDHVICDPAIGRMHAEISWANNLCQIRDLNSKNGTFVNGQRLAGPQRVSISIGDEIKLGPLEYTLAKD